MEAGADLAMVMLYTDVTDDAGERDRLDLKRDIPAIEDRLAEFPDIRLLIIDPIGCFSGGEDFNNPLLRAAVLGATALVLTGVLLLAMSLRRRRRHKGPQAA
jgi:hypothetical protein